MIHIIDPRINSPLLDLSPRVQKSRKARYLADRAMHEALLVAVREPSGRYRALKTRFHSLPAKPITRTRLLRMIEETMERADSLLHECLVAMA